MATKEISAALIVSAICRDTRYSRSHVAKVLRTNAKKLKARRIGREWVIAGGYAHSYCQLKELVMKSGPRYKLKERGPHISTLLSGDQVF